MNDAAKNSGAAGSASAGTARPLLMILGVLAIFGVVVVAIAVWVLRSTGESEKPGAPPLAARENSPPPTTTKTALPSQDVVDAGASKPSPTAETRAMASATRDSVVRDRTFDDLKFELAPDGAFDRSLLSASINELFGSKIRIRGYILPTAHQDGVKQFVLVRDNLECCFGPGATIYDCILVDMSPGQSTSFTVRPITVEGTLQYREIIGPDGKHLAIYGLTADAVD